MDTSKKFFGIAGISSVVIFLAATIISIVGFENGAYSPASCFVGELGLFSGVFFSGSVAMFFNIGLIAAGLLFCVFMVHFGISKNSGIWAATSFFGVIVGVLIAAQGFFSLNYTQYHLIISTAFFAAMFVLCALFVIAAMRDNSTGLIKIILAFVAGILSAIFAGFMITGGMARVFAQDAAGVGRLNLNPFTLIEWAVFLALFALIAMLAIHTLTHSDRHQAKSKFIKPRKIRNNNGLGTLEL